MAMPCLPGAPTCATCKPSSLAINRAATAERTKRDRLAAVATALDACGFNVSAERFRPGHDYAVDLAEVLPFARAQVQALRARLSDGSDEPRYAATGVALSALGALWAVST